jgi:riboflavin kinase/FMN adenylyltransferase
VALGVFDGVHQGHRHLIDHARSIATGQDLPLVLVTFDPHPAKVLQTGRDTAELTTPDRRAELAGQLGVDAVCVMEFTHRLARLSPRQFAHRVLVDCLRAREVVVGVNFTFGARATGNLTTLRDLGEELGFSAHGVPLLDAVDTPCSSTYIRGCLRAGQLDAAAQALGRPHQIDGHRYHDRIHLPDDTALPPPGRYTCAINGRPGIVEVSDAGALRIIDAVNGPISVTFHRALSGRRR